MNKKDGLYEYISEYDEQLMDKISAHIEDKYSVTEEFDQKMKKICMQKKSKRSKYHLKIATAMVGTFIVLVGTGIVTNAATDGKVADAMRKFLGITTVTEEVQELIGKEVIDDGVLEVEEDIVNENNLIDDGQKQEKVFAESKIVESAEKSGVIPTSIQDVQVKGGTTPEIIMTNGAMAVFYQKDYSGWKCETGEELVFEYEKYASDVTDEQNIIVGYILDGVMYEGEAYKDLSGNCRMNIEKEGEYYIYVVSATSDYVTLKAGTIHVEK